MARVRPDWQRGHKMLDTTFANKRSCARHNLPADADLKSCLGAQETRRRTASLKLDGPCGYHAPGQGGNLASHRSTYKTVYPPISPTRLPEPTGAAWVRYCDNSGAHSLNPNNHPPTENNSSQNTRSPHNYTHHHPYTRRTRGAINGVTASARMNHLSLNR